MLNRASLSRMHVFFHMRINPAYQIQEMMSRLCRHFTLALVVCTFDTFFFLIIHMFAT